MVQLCLFHPSGRHGLLHDFGHALERRGEEVSRDGELGALSSGMMGMAAMPIERKPRTSAAKTKFP